MGRFFFSAMCFMIMGTYPGLGFFQRCNFFPKPLSLSRLLKVLFYFFLRLTNERPDDRKNLPKLGLFVQMIHVDSSYMKALSLLDLASRWFVRCSWKNRNTRAGVKLQVTRKTWRISGSPCITVTPQIHLKYYRYTLVLESCDKTQRTTYSMRNSMEARTQPAICGVSLSHISTFLHIFTTTLTSS